MSGDIHLLPPTEKVPLDPRGNAAQIVREIHRDGSLPAALNPSTLATGLLGERLSDVTCQI